MLLCYILCYILITAIFNYLLQLAVGTHRCFSPDVCVCTLYVSSPRVYCSSSCICTVINQCQSGMELHWGQRDHRQRTSQRISGQLALWTDRQFLCSSCYKSGKMDIHALWLTMHVNVLYKCLSNVWNLKVKEETLELAKQLIWCIWFMLVAIVPQLFVFNMFLCVSCHRKFTRYFGQHLFGTRTFMFSFVSLISGLT